MSSKRQIKRFRITDGGVIKALGLGYPIMLMFDWWTDLDVAYWQASLLALVVSLAVGADNDLSFEFERETGGFHL